MTQPLGNNGDHSVFLGEDVNGEWEVLHLEFEEWVVGTGWTNAYESGPLARSITTENLCISGCTASNGTIDYFKYDPDGDESLAEPHITFTIVDPDPHKYTVVVRYRETIGDGTWNWDTGGWSWYKADVQDDLTVDLNLTSPGYDQECLNADDNPWGTYTYDLLVMEYDGPTPAWVQANAIDWQFLKRYRDGYHLWVPENLPSPHGDEPGHEVWTEVPENGDAGLRGFYCLESDWGAQEAQVVRGQDAQIVIVDPELEERSNTSGPAAVETLGADYGTEDADSDGELDGLPLYTYQDSDPAGTWRGIFMANDNGGVHSPKWRTHEPVRMLTANAKVNKATFQVWFDWDCSQTCGLDDPHPTVWYWSHIKNAFQTIAGVDYEAYWYALEHPIPSGVVGGARLTQQQQDASYTVPYHVTTFFHDTSWTSSTFWPGLTVTGNGTPDSPDRGRYNDQMVQNDTDRPQPPTLDNLAWGRSQVILHELGHAAGAPHHPVTGQCVMDESLEAHHYSKVHPQWGEDDHEHLMDHINQIREHLNYPLY